MKKLKKYIVSLIIPFFATISLNGQIVINEIHPAPVNNQPEWIEIFNTDNLEYIFQGGYLNDAVGMKKLPPFVILPRHYVILTKDSIEFLQRWSKQDSCIIIQTSLPTFNNDNDVVMLRNLDSLLLDSIYYNMKNGFRGISLERINPYLNVVDFENLKASVSPDSSTPGKWNSVSVPVVDVKIELIDISNDSLKLELTNLSSNSINIDEFLLSFDINNDGIFSIDELTSSFYNVTIQANEKLYLSYELSSLFSLIDLYGIIYFKAEVKVTNDDDNKNNFIISNFNKTISPNSLLINEIMYDVNENQAEYVELYNSSTNNVILNNILLHDRYYTSGYDSLIIRWPSPILKAGQYLAITWDSSFFEQFPDLVNSPNVIFAPSAMNMNIYDDDVLLLSPNSEVMDSLSYYNYWHNSEIANTKGKSLEKINPYLITSIVSSWTTSLDFQGGTPGRENSIFKEQQLEGELSAEPNPFAPDGNQKDRFCMIHYELPFDNAKLDIKIYDENGGEVRYLVKQFQSGKSGLFTWDGMNNEGYKLDIGPYVLILTAKNSSGKDYSNRILLVIGG